MKTNRIMWGIVSLVVLVTIAVTVGTFDSHSQQKAQNPSKEQNNDGYQDLSKYAIADYDASDSANADEREERRIKSQRYDNQDFVRKNPHPDDGGASRHSETTPPPIIPAIESDLVVTGEIVGANAFLSNDKENVYTEFTVCIKEVLKSHSSNKAAQQGGCIIADRTGGFVRYPSGQKVLYRDADHDLPHVGNEYVLFLTSDKKSPNYEILVGYELKNGTVTPLDRGRSFEEFKGRGNLFFIEAVRNAIPRSTNK